MKINVMDKIWDRIPLKSGVIGRCGMDEKKWMTTQNRRRMLNIKNCLLKTSLLTFDPLTLFVEN